LGYFLHKILGEALIEEALFHLQAEPAPTTLKRLI
jgi:hypothetical protein